MQRPQTTVILAMSLDGKIADKERSPARFGSAADKRHLESQIAQLDALLIGGGTLRAYGTSLPITTAQLLAARQVRGQTPQPVHIICSVSGNLSPHLPFFRQPLPHWLLTTPQAASFYTQNGFEKILVSAGTANQLDWHDAFRQFRELGWQKLGILGGSELVASLLEADLVDEIYLTLCPYLLGGKNAPTAVGGEGFLEYNAPRLQLIKVQAVGDEVFLHYRRTQQRDSK
jgi:5-amino-6-(5-phosphoribosylamino)uracil reductase